MMSYICLLCVALIGVPGSYGFSDSTLNFFAIFNGNYDNSLQYQHGFTKHALISFRLVPVDVAVLRPATVYYLEWAADGKVLLMLIGVVTEGPGENIFITLFNFTDLSLYKPGQFNVSTVSDLKLEDLRGNNCTAAFKALSPAVFVGYFPDCRTVVKKQHPDYGNTFLCDEASIIVPPTEEETFSQVPYVFHRQGPRYQLIGLPDTYDSVCGKKV